MHFGISRQPTARIEIVFALKSGNHVTAYQETAAPVTAESLDAFAKELAEQLAGNPGQRTFVDDWGASGQRAWVNLSEVAAFSVRPAR